jgi:hypothetical protein
LFQRRRFLRNKPDADTRLGLVVGQRALQIFDAKGNLIYDQLPEIEEANIRAKRPAVKFFNEEGLEEK